MCPPTKLHLPIFDPKKCYNPLSSPVLSRFISARIFFVPQVENEIKRTPLCGCCWDTRSHNWSIKERPKRGIFSSLSGTVQPCKSLYIFQWSLFGGGSMCLPHVSSIFKKFCPKTFGQQCVSQVIFLYRVTSLQHPCQWGNRLATATFGKWKYFYCYITFQNVSAYSQLVNFVDKAIIMPKWWPLDKLEK